MKPLMLFDVSKTPQTEILKSPNDESLMQAEHFPRWWFYFVTPVVAVVITLVIIELGLVIFHPIPLPMEKRMYFEPDPFTGYRLRPDPTGYFQQQTPVRINENGHRDEFVPVRRVKDVVRILVLGDSFTVGARVAQDEAYTEVLETLLTRSSSVPMEVINAGVGGWEPFQYAQYYRHYGRKFSPDLVLVGFFVGNDTYNQMTMVHQSRSAILGWRISRSAKLDRFIHLKVFAVEHSNIARLIVNGPTPGSVTRQNCSDFSRHFLKIQRDRLGNHKKRTRALERKARNSINQIKRIKKLAKQESIPLVVVLIPDENQINGHLSRVLLTDEQRRNFDFDMPQTMLRDMFAHAAIPVVDLLSHFREDSRCLYMNDTHWTAEGHALAATVIYENIKTRVLGRRQQAETRSNGTP